MPQRRWQHSGTAVQQPEPWLMKINRLLEEERATTLTITNNVNAAVPPHVSSVVFSISLQTIPINKGFIYCKHVKNSLYM